MLVVSVPLNAVAVPLPPPVNDAGTPLAFQVYVVFAGIIPVRAGLKLTPLQTVVVKLSTDAKGNTVTVAEKGVPVHPLVFGVMV